MSWVITEWVAAGVSCQEQMTFMPTTWAISNPLCHEAEASGSSNTQQAQLPLTRSSWPSPGSVKPLTAQVWFRGHLRPSEASLPCFPPGSDHSPGDQAPPHPGQVHLHRCGAGRCPHSWRLGGRLGLQERWGACRLLSVRSRQG